MHRPRILAISGSTKSKSTSAAILEYIAKKYQDKCDVQIFDAIGDLPHFNPDLVTTSLPTSVSAFHQQIEQADAVLWCTPEYVYSLPGSLKNAIEWCVAETLFSGKPVAMIVAAASGQKAFESLGLILSTIECVLPKSSKLLIPGAKGKLNEGTVDLSLDDQLSTLVSSLLESIAQTGNPTKFQS